MISISILLFFLTGCTGSMSQETQKPPVEIETRPVKKTPFDTHIEKLNKYFKEKSREWR
jgi:PBP1b-binding outer membrane lipoprotein LpoB